MLVIAAREDLEIAREVRRVSPLATERRPGVGRPSTASLDPYLGVKRNVTTSPSRTS